MSIHFTQFDIAAWESVNNVWSKVDVLLDSSQIF